MEIEETIERLEDIKIFLELDVGESIELTVTQQMLLAQNLEIVLNHITKQDKMIKEYEEMIIRHKEQLRKAGIYGYDYDLKVLTGEIE